MSMPVRTGCPDCDASSAGVCPKHARQHDVVMDIRRPFPCPICLGRGTVPAHFYGGYTPLGYPVNPDTCRSCGGNGIVWG